jgi:hypothetical protein
VKERVAGIVNSLLDNKKYAITLVIQELTWDRKGLLPIFNKNSVTNY